MTKHLKKSLRTAARARPKHHPKGLWSAERRARQAEVIRASQPWKKSTGPQTSSGKARSAANALKHGFRSRAFIERVRQERQLIHDAASTIALAKLVLGPRGACPPAAWSLSSGRAEPVLRPRFARTGGRGHGGRGMTEWGYGVRRRRISAMTSAAGRPRFLSDSNASKRRSSSALCAGVSGSAF